MNPHTPRYASLLVATACMAGGALPTHAFDPNEGAPPTITRQYRTLPESVVPARYYTDTTLAPAAVEAAPAVIAPLPTPIRNTPVEQPIAYVAPAPAYVAAPIAPAYVPNNTPVNDVVRVEPSYAPTPAPQRNGKNRFSLGIEGYYDEYQEDSVALTDTGMFGGINASYTHYFRDDWYGEIDLRAAYGSTDYESISGTIDDINQWETDSRILAGYDSTTQGGGQRIKAYLGLGNRYFVDELKGKTASLGGLGYDRRIYQLYLPIGVTYAFPAYGLTFTPNFEFDKLLWGNVSSRLGTIPGFQNIENEQTEGYGLRAEFMVGQTNENGRGWQFGPFVRYWDIPDSKVDAGFIEPENTRLQAGAKLKVLF